MLPRTSGRTFSTYWRTLENGFDLRPEWFKAQQFASLQRQVEYEGNKRTASNLDWHVMGEEGRSAERCALSIVGRTAAGSAESSNPSRHAVACNGRAVPLTPTGYLAFRSLASASRRGIQPPVSTRPACEHAMTFDIMIHGPTVRSGLHHHVAHPGGRNCETFPVNGNEARPVVLLGFGRGHTAGAARCNRSWFHRNS